MSAQPEDADRREPEDFLPLRTNWFYIMLAIAGGERHGYAIRKKVEERTDGKVRLWPATLYGALESMTDSGLISETEERPGPEDDSRRRYYALTSLGQEVLAAEADRLEELVLAARAGRVASKPTTA